MRRAKTAKMVVILGILGIDILYRNCYTDIKKVYRKSTAENKMMITVKCDKTGIEFQADSKRQKNHPLVSKFLDAAGKDNGRYVGASRKAQQILAEIKSAGYSDINDAITEAYTVYADWCENGNSGRKVMSHKERIQAGERIIRHMRRMDDGMIEELNDGVGGRYNGSVR